LQEKTRASTLSIVLMITPNRARKLAVSRRRVRVFSESEESGAQVNRQIIAIISVYDRVPRDILTMIFSDILKAFMRSVNVGRFVSRLPNVSRPTMHRVKTSLLQLIILLRIVLELGDFTWPK